MKFLFLALLVAGISISLVLLTEHDPGYVMINYSGMSVESTLSLFLIAQIVALVVFYFAVRLVVRTLHMVFRMPHWRSQRRARHAREDTHHGLIALAEGNWARAEKLLSRSAKVSETPLINYLGATHAAQKQNAEERRDQYLSQAYQSMPDAELAVGLTQADVQLSQGQLEQALATLRHLRGISPKHTHVLYLLKKLYEKLESWDDLLDLLPDLQRNHVLAPDDLEELEHRIHRMRLAAAAQERDKLTKCWDEVPKALRRSPDLIHDYAKQLIRIDAEGEAEKILREALKKQWDPHLIRLYGRVRGEDINLQLATAEKWLPEYETHPELLLTLGRLSLYDHLWGKARSYLEASLGMEPRAETYCELGNLVHQLGETEKAAEYYHHGLQMACIDYCSEFNIPAIDKFHPPATSEIHSES